jgi:molecular chaperone GrpE (heat shock protein)
MIGKIITAASILALVLSLGAVSATVYAQPADMNNTNITISELAQNVTGNVTVVPLGNVSLANMTSQANQNQNQSQLFQGLENSTAILNSAIETAEENANQSHRAQIKIAVADALKDLGNVADKVDTATSEQMRTLQTTVEAVSDAIEQFFND